jgi:hypothetical protein
MSQTGHEEPLGLFGAGSNSDQLDAHPALTEHDRNHNNTGDDGGADHESVGERLAHEMRDHDRMRAGREMRQGEKRAEPIIRHEADVFRIRHRAASGRGSPQLSRTLQSASIEQLCERTAMDRASRRLL